ncbi:hypothetical protein PHYSODRAFT_285165 [Phytophthora sojae]|uniref:Uncharacterized protein n=1 Tax=Phytophthora sojae (strain P6497) TaxID=1094619 RepID=G4YXE0_PHYSP|nr:hypothetical protein PHYSODRAFT_285165 [Phytophthora sojae]EGZ26174.1 hypothetical protein PHYSODRAFT_285165 [Phytophthora sojae]|eukprot:XP_009521462.1 hypothetical protein PHYSODRAFT_285165 [Phytophthora sojae]
MPDRWAASDPRNVTTQPSLGRHKLFKKTPRPNPQSQSFSRSYDFICRLPLSIFFYQLEAANLGDLIRL